MNEPNVGLVALEKSPSTIAGGFLTRFPLPCDPGLTFQFSEQPDNTERLANFDKIEKSHAVLQHRNLELATALMRMEAERDEALRCNLGKSAFLSHMSHEIRTPLNAILGFSEFFLSDEGLSSETRVNMGYIEQSGQQILSMVDNMTDLARMESGRLRFSLEPVQARMIVSQCIEQFALQAKESDVSLIDLSRNDQTVIVQADPVRLRQVVGNLMSNAILYNHRGGQIHLSVVRKNDACRIIVSDTGSGIAPDKHAGVFKLFERLGAENSSIAGKGIALAISRHIVEAMGGHIGFESKPDLGSHFWVEFPTHETKTVQEKTPIVSHVSIESSESIDSPIIGLQDDSKTALQKKMPHVLVLDDYAPNCDVLKQQLMQLDCTVEVAGDGAIGIELCANATFDLILTDLNMPVMNGIAFTCALRQQEKSDGRHTPVVAITGSDDAIEMQSCRDAGMDDTILKPLSFNTLRTLLSQWAKFDDGQEHAEEMLNIAVSTPIDFQKIFSVIGRVDIDRANRVVNKFIVAATNGLRILDDQADNVDAIAWELHKQKSSARCAGAMQYAQLAETIETRAKSGQLTDPGSALTSLRMALEEIVKAMQPTLSID